MLAYCLICEELKLDPGEVMGTRRLSPLAPIISSVTPRMESGVIDHGRSIGASSKASSGTSPMTPQTRGVR